MNVDVMISLTFNEETKSRLLEIKKELEEIEENIKHEETPFESDIELDGDEEVVVKGLEKRYHEIDLRKIERKKRLKIQEKEMLEIYDLECEGNDILFKLSILTQKLCELKCQRYQNMVKQDELTVKVIDDDFDVKEVNVSKYLISSDRLEEVVQLNASHLKEWCGCDSFKIVFDTKSNGWDHALFNTIVLHQKDLMFVIVNENNDIFGIYIGSEITGVGQWIKDESHFLFCFGIDGVRSLQKWKRNQSIVDWNYSVSINHTNAEYLFYTYACGIQSASHSGKSYFNAEFVKMYSIEEPYSHLFRKGRFDAKRVLCLQWK
ncbi:TLDc domain-containing protein [Entamoeba marina]